MPCADVILVMCSVQFYRMTCISYLSPPTNACRAPKAASEDKSAHFAFRAALRFWRPNSREEAIYIVHARRGYRGLEPESQAPKISTPHRWVASPFTRKLGNENVCRGKTIVKSWPRTFKCIFSKWTSNSRDKSPGHTFVASKQKYWLQRIRLRWI